MQWRDGQTVLSESDSDEDNRLGTLFWIGLSLCGSSAGYLFGWWGGLAIFTTGLLIVLFAVVWPEARTLRR